MPDSPSTKRRHRAAVPRRGEGVAEQLQLARAPDEGRRRRRLRGGRRLHQRCGRADLERGHDFGAAAAPRRIDGEQTQAQRLQLGRYGRRARAWRSRQLRLLALQDFDRRAGERHLAGQRLVQHDADGVPVSGRRHRLGQCLLGRQVGRGADDLVGRGARRASSLSTTRPRSSSTTRPCRVTRTFDGLMSRCTLPAPCSATSPVASCNSVARSRDSSSLPCGRTCDKTSPPSTSSMVKNHKPSCWMSSPRETRL